MDKDRVADALRDVLASPQFGRSPRLSSLLDYLVTKTLDGEADSLKGYSIGVDVFERPETFDPANDPIVRVQAGRLRKALNQYYHNLDAPSSVRIEIPSGTYVPLFEQVPESEALEHSVKDNAQEMVPKGTQTHPWQRFMVVGVVLAAMAAIAAAVLTQTSEPNGVFTDTPIVEIQEFDSSGHEELSTVLTGFREQMMLDLQHFGTLKIRDIQALDQAGPRGANDLVHANYSLTGSVSPIGSGPEFILKLQSKKDQTLVWSERIAMPQNDLDFYQAMRDTVSSVVVKIAGIGGAIPTDVMRRLDMRIEQLGNASTSEYECLLTAYSFDLTKDPRVKNEAEICLSKYIARNSRNSDIWTQSAIFNFIKWSNSSDGTDNQLLRTALQQARNAVRLNPQNALTFENLGSILSAQGDRKEAIEAYIKARELAPLNPSTNFLLGWQMVLEGDWDEGMAAVRRGVEMAEIAPGWMIAPLAMDAFRREEYTESLRFAERVRELGDGRGDVLMLAALLAKGDLDQAQHIANRLVLREEFEPTDPMRSVRLSYSNPSVIEAYQDVILASGVLASD